MKNKHHYYYYYYVNGERYILSGYNTNSWNEKKPGIKWRKCSP